MINIIKSGVGNIGSIVRVLEDLDYEYKKISFFMQHLYQSKVYTNEINLDLIDPTCGMLVDRDNVGDDVEKFS